MLKIIKFTTVLTTLSFSFLNPTFAKDATREGISSDSNLLTIFLKHDQSKNIDQIKEILEKQNFSKVFPPKDTTVVSWYVLMGIGQVVTLEVPASKLREVNLSIEQSGWGAFKTEFYPTYNLYPAIKGKLSNKLKKNL